MTDKSGIYWKLGAKSILQGGSCFDLKAGLFRSGMIDITAGDIDIACERNQGGNSTAGLDTVGTVFHSYALGYSCWFAPGVSAGDLLDGVSGHPGGTSPPTTVPQIVPLGPCVKRQFRSQMFDSVPTP